MNFIGRHLAVAIAASATALAAQAHSPQWFSPDGKRGHFAKFDSAWTNSLAKTPSDCVEIDFMHLGLVRKTGGKPAPAVDAFVRKAGTTIRAAGKKVAVRVPYDPESCVDFGLDAVKWAKDGLVDVVIPAPFSKAASDLPVEDWKEALAGSKALLLPDLGREVNSPDKAYVPAIYRGIAKSFVERGVGGDVVNFSPKYGEESHLSTRLSSRIGRVCRFLVAVKD